MFFVINSSSMEFPPGYQMKKNGCCLLCVGLLLVLIVVCGAIFFYIPKQYCNIETEVEIIRLGDSTSATSVLQNRVYRSRHKPDYLCEDGVEITDLDSIGSIWFEGKDKVCMIKYKIENCETKYVRWR